MKNLKNAAIAIALTAVTAASFAAQPLIKSISAQTAAYRATYKSSEITVNTNSDLSSSDIRSANVIRIAEGAVSIGDYAFQNCTNLEELYIPSTVKYISSTAFVGCSGIEKFSVASGNVTFASKNGALFTADGTTLVRFNTGSANKTYNIPNGTVTISANAFLNSQLNSVSIPDSVTSVGTNAFYNVPAEMTKISSNLKKIGASAFEGTKISTLRLPSATEIGNRAFANNSCLEIAHINASLSSINTGIDIFINCPKLKDVKYAGTKDQWKALAIKVNSDTLVTFQGGASGVDDGTYIIVYENETANKSTTKTTSASGTTKTTTSTKRTNTSSKKTSTSTTKASTTKAATTKASTTKTTKTAARNARTLSNLYNRLFAA